MMNYYSVYLTRGSAAFIPPRSRRVRRKRNERSSTSVSCSDQFLEDGGTMLEEIRSQAFTTSLPMRRMSAPV